MVSIIYSKGKIEADVAESWKEKAVGLRGKQTGSMIFQVENKKPIIDMVLVQDKLQIIFLSEDLTVNEIIHAQPGLKFYKPEEKCSYFIETFFFTNIREGEKLEINF